VSIICDQLGWVARKGVWSRTVVGALKKELRDAMWRWESRDENRRKSDKKKDPSVIKKKKGWKVLGARGRTEWVYRIYRGLVKKKARVREIILKTGWETFN